jgi:cell division protein ZapA
MAEINITVELLDKPYQMCCSEEQAEIIQQAAKHLDREMRAIRDQGRVVASERLAIMAALTVTHQLLALQQQSSLSLTQAFEKIRQLYQKLHDALNQCEQTSF